MLLAFSTSALAGDKERVLSQCESIFGKAIDQKLNLFDINKDFVLSVAFDGDALTSFSVKPKYYWNKEHAEWKQPAERPWLLQTAYSDLVTKLDSVKPKRRIVSKGFVGVCSNSNCWYQNYYEDAFLEYASHGDVGVSSLFVSFFHDITGEVYVKNELKPNKDERAGGNENVYQVKVSGKVGDSDHTYYVRKQVYDSLKKGKDQSFLGALVN